MGKEKRRLQQKAILVCVTSRVEGKQKILITQPEPCLAAEFSLTSVSGVSTVSADCNEKGVCVGGGGQRNTTIAQKLSLKAFIRCLPDEGSKAQCDVNVGKQLDYKIQIRL